MRMSLATLLCSACLLSYAESAPIKYQVTGLFMADREQDLREAVARIPELILVAIDFKNAEVTLDYKPEKPMPNAKPDQVLQKIDMLIKNASNHTFSIKPPRSVSADKLKWIEIPVGGLDCKACSFAAYLAIFNLEGVEQATASFREGRVTALIDPEKTDRTKIEAALIKRGVQIKTP